MVSTTVGHLPSPGHHHTLSLSPVRPTLTLIHLTSLALIGHTLLFTNNWL